MIKERLGRWRRLYLLPLDCLLRSTNSRDIEREYKAAKILCLYQTVLFIYIYVFTRKLTFFFYFWQKCKTTSFWLFFLKKFQIKKKKTRFRTPSADSKPPPLPRLAAARERREFARSASRWSLRLKSWSGVLWKERESMWWSWRVAVEVEMESGSASVTVERDSDSGSGHEMVVLWSSDRVLNRFLLLLSFLFFFFNRFFLFSLNSDFFFLKIPKRRRFGSINGSP